MSDFNVYQIIKPYITHVSAQLHAVSDYEKEYKIGGKIISIFDMNELTLNSSSTTPVHKDHDMGVYVIIDDGIGQTRVVISQAFYKEACTMRDTLIGEIVVFEGYVVRLKKITKTLPQRGSTMLLSAHPNQEKLPLLFAMDMKLWKDDE